MFVCYNSVTHSLTAARGSLFYLLPLLINATLQSRVSQVGKSQWGTCNLFCIYIRRLFTLHQRYLRETLLFYLNFKFYNMPVVEHRCGTCLGEVCASCHFTFEYCRNSDCGLNYYFRESKEGLLRCRRCWSWLCDQGNEPQHDYQCQQFEDSPDDPTPKEDRVKVVKVYLENKIQLTQHQDNIESPDVTDEESSGLPDIWGESKVEDRESSSNVSDISMSVHYLKNYAVAVATDGYLEASAVIKE